jgi:hypothetical protein
MFIIACSLTCFLVHERRYQYGILAAALRQKSVMVICGKYNHAQCNWSGDLDSQVHKSNTIFRPILLPSWPVALDLFGFACSCIVALQQGPFC